MKILTDLEEELFSQLEVCQVEFWDSEVEF